MIAFDENLIALLDSLSRIKSTPLLEKTNRRNDDYYSTAISIQFVSVTLASYFNQPDDKKNALSCLPRNGEMR